MKKTGKEEEEIGRVLKIHDYGEVKEEGERETRVVTIDGGSDSRRRECGSRRRHR
jgi:hypothetical protein